MNKKQKYLDNKVKSIHFIGIGGIGMCGLAEYLLDKGYKVTGSDLTKSFITERLESKGAKIFYGHSEKNLKKGADLVVYTSAVKADNPEYKMALKLKVKTIKRAVLLGEIVNDMLLIAVSGTHGKTSTTSMLSKILIDNGFNPTVFVGGNLSVLGGASYRIGSNIAIVEADEYDRSFLTLNPDIIIINNIELDHVDIYKNVKSLMKSFKDFAGKLKTNGCFIVNWDDKNIRDLFKSLKSDYVFKYGMIRTDVISKVKVKNFKTEYELTGNKVTLKVLGYHNVYNSTAAIIASSLIFNNIKKIIKSISTFNGVKRRLELKYDKNFKVFDDYGHHPSEVKTTLLSLKANDKGRLIVVFQPHTFTRLHKFYKEFAKALEIADVVYLLPVYPAREKEIKGVKSELIYNILNKKNHKVFLIDKNEELFSHLKKVVKKNDRVVFQGAGTVTNVCDEFVKGVKGK